MKASALKRNPFFLIGICGFAVTAALQIAFLFASMPGADNWALWLSCYGAWVAFTLIGLATSRGKGDKPES